MSTISAPRILVTWEKTLKRLMQHTNSFPKKMRHTLTNRIDNLAIDLYETLVEARYHRHPADHLHRANLLLEKLRLFLRLSHDLRHLSDGALRNLTEACDETGRMIGGWLRSIDP